MSDVARAIRGVTVLSFGGLCLAVVFVGVVAVVAQLVQTWTWFFRMEQVVGLATPLITALLAVTLLGAMGTVLVASTD